MQFITHLQDNKFLLKDYLPLPDYAGRKGKISTEFQ